MAHMRCRLVPRVRAGRADGGRRAADRALPSAPWGRTDLIPALPLTARAIAAGSRGIIDTMAAEGIAFAAGAAEGMTYSVNCADRGRLFDAGAVEPFDEDHPELRSLVHLQVPEIACEAWNVAPAADDFNDLLTEDDAGGVPVVVMTFVP
jgi:hypothetical protein